MLNGLYDAAMDNQPVVAIVGQQGLNAFGTFTMQAIELIHIASATSRPDTFTSMT